MPRKASGSSAEDAAEKCETHDDVEPFFNQLAVHSGELDEQVAEHRPHDELPDALNPEMHDPPAVEGVERLIFEINHPRQIKQGCREQAEVKDDGCRGRSISLPDRHPDVRDKG